MSNSNKIGHKKALKGIDFCFLTSDVHDGPRSRKDRRWCKRFTSKMNRNQAKKEIKEIKEMIDEELENE